jgi:hypothetical protein
MFLPSRRAFLGSALAGLATTPFWGPQRPEPRAPAAGDDPPFQPDTLFLTWQRDPTTTMTVQWVGAEGEIDNPCVWYAPAGSEAAWQRQPVRERPFPGTDLKVFRAELTDLIPGQDYEFRLGRQSPTYRFRTMPARATDTIHFISGGDCGINVHAIANNRQAARQDPMFVVLGGDLGYDNGVSASTALAFIRNYSRNVIGQGGRLVPLLACIGNHEVIGGYRQPRRRAPFFYALFDGLYPDTGYACLDFGDYLSLVLLDTNHTSAIGGEQADWLDRTLRARRDHPHVFVVNHVPAYPSYRNPEGLHGLAGCGADNRRHWVPLFERYRVPVVLEHHDHTFKRTQPLLGGLAHPNGVLYLGDGSWGRLRTPKTPDQLPYLARSSRAFHLSLHRLEGQQRFHLAFDEHGRVMDVCQSSQRTRGLVRVPG